MFQLRNDILTAEQCETVLSAFHILVVEDNPGDARLIIEALKDAGVDAGVHVEDSGAGALEFLHGRGCDRMQPRPAMVLLDLNLPQIDGFDVLRALKSDATLRTVPVIVFSSSGDE